MPPFFALATAFIACVSLTPAVRRLALNIGFVDHPNARKLHLTPMPLLGGLAIYAATMLGVILFSDSRSFSEILGILAGASLLAIIGTLDDRGLLHHQIKLMVAMPLAAVFLIASGLHISFFSLLPLPGPALLWLLADDAITLIWVVGITASFSIFDHMDGLCAGVAAIASAFFLVIALRDGELLGATLAGAVMGAAIGFLGWNFKPAKIFMGDAGAMFLGFMLAALSLKLHPAGPADGASWLAVILVLGVPILDTALVSVSRTRRGLIPFATPGKDHTAHRLSNLGLGQRNAVVILYLLGVVFGLTALLVAQLAAWESYLLMGAIVVVGLVAIYFLERAPFERQQPKKHDYSS